MLPEMYVSDYNNKRIRKITLSTGIITTIAGTGTQGYSGDGGAATAAKISAAQGIALDVSGNLCIVDSGNNRIRKVTAGYWHYYYHSGGQVQQDIQETERLPRLRSSTIRQVAALALSVSVGFYDMAGKLV